MTTKKKSRMAVCPVCRKYSTEPGKICKKCWRAGGTIPEREFTDQQHAVLFKLWKGEDLDKAERRVAAQFKAQGFVGSTKVNDRETRYLLLPAGQKAAGFPPQRAARQEGESCLSCFQRVIDAGADRRRAERQAFADEIGEPNETVTDEDGRRTGFWRVEGGVLAFAFDNKGIVRPETRVEYTDEMIQMLARLHAITPPGGEADG